MTLERSAALRGSVLVTGAAGFVGRWLVPVLLREYEVVGVLRPGDAPSDAAVQWVACELTDAEAVAKLIDSTRPSHVVHLAAQAVPRQAARSPLEALRSNYLAVHYLAEALRRSAPRARLLFVSSGEVYGRRAREAPPAREDDPTCPENVYAATKLAAERRLALEFERCELDVVRARPFNHTGPGRPTQYAESSFADQIARAERAEGEPCVRVGNLEAVRDFSDVRDVVEAYAVLLARGAAGGVYNVCSGQGRSVRSILDLLVAQSRVPITVHPDPERFEPTPPDRAALVGDPSALRALGYAPRRSFESTLRDLLDDRRVGV